MVINHIPQSNNSSHLGTRKTPKSHSVVEIFHHTINTNTATHVRTIWHPLITTPNDLVALSPTSFLITNDHYFREGYLKFFEDVNWLGRWANVVHVRFESSSANETVKDETSSVQASLALSNIHSANGIGHGRTKDEIVVTSAASGVAHLGDILTDSSGKVTIQVKESIKFDSMLDNPSYFRDPYATPGYDASSFIFAGLAKACKIFWTMRNPGGFDPSIVWRMSASRLEMDSKRIESKIESGWHIRQIFEDDGARMRSSSTALMVAIDPSVSIGKRQAWLFITGFFADNMVVFKVDL
ncbi:hypothetical protein PWT90_06463 [Aphanocladium album]|nr:hypothetical protein PWT90_06463 [Aphanocladium album]